MNNLSFELPTLKSTRTPDPEFEQKRLLEPEFLAIINTKERQWSAVGFRGRMWDSGHKTSSSWYQLLSEMKQSKSPGACWGAKTKGKIN